MARDEMLFLAEASVRYHRERAAHFERISKVVTILTLLLGGGAFLTIFAHAPLVAGIAGLLVALLNGYRLIGKPDDLVARHKGWCSGWQEILTEVGVHPSPTAGRLQRWVTRKHAIEAECVVEMNALKAHCFNRTLAALDLAGEPYPLKRRHRLLKQWLSFPHAFDGMEFR